MTAGYIYRLVSYCVYVCLSTLRLHVGYASWGIICYNILKTYALIIRAETGGSRQGKKNAGIDQCKISFAYVIDQGNQSESSKACRVNMTAPSRRIL